MRDEIIHNPKKVRNEKMYRRKTADENKIPTKKCQTKRQSEVPGILGWYYFGFMKNLAPPPLYLGCLVRYDTM